MRRIKQIIFILLILGSTGWGWFKGVAYLPQPQKQITIYGSLECPRCVELKQDLSKQGIRYGFKDVNQSEFYSDEMWVAIWKQNPNQKTVDLPVVLIDEKLMRNPKPEKVIAHYNRPVFSWKAIDKQWIKRDSSHANIYISVQ